MRIAFITVVTILLFNQCTQNEKAPDVSSIKINLKTQRFEQDLFRLDTLNFQQNSDQLISKYPSFGENFIYTILNADANWVPDTVTAYLSGFTKAYKNVFDSSQRIFKDFSPYEKEIEKALKYYVYYFPKTILPNKLITYIGPLDGYGDIYSSIDSTLMIGLHIHLGKDFSLYQSEMVQQVYPAYITNRFEPEYIVINAVKNILLDNYPEIMAEKTLVHQMIEKGKRLYVLSKLLPKVDEDKLIGYTQLQLKDCYAHEKVIWDLFVQNSFLQTIDNNIIKNYIGESPKTQELGEASPGNIGSFAGWQIVKKYMRKNPATTLTKLMSTENEIIFSEAKYKP